LGGPDFLSQERAPQARPDPSATRHGKDAFHRVPDFAQNEWDAVERVLTILEGRFRGRDPPRAGRREC
jgi:hypothetical protein